MLQDEIEKGYMLGEYVIVIKDQTQAQKLLNQDNILLQGLLQNHIPLIFEEDFLKMNHKIEIILDYYDISQEQIEQESYINAFGFSYLFQRQVIQNNNVQIKEQYHQNPIRTKSFDQQQQTIQKSNDSKFKTIYFIYNIDENENLIQNSLFKEQDIQISLGNFQQQIPNFILQGIRSQKWFLILALTYEKLNCDHFNFIKLIFCYYIQFPNQRQQILEYILIWLTYREVDLINEYDKISKLLQEMLIFFKLISLNITTIKQIEMKIIQLFNQQQHRIQKGKLNSLYEKHVRLAKTFNQPSQIKKLNKKNNRNLSLNELQSNQISQLNFNGYYFYLTTNVDILQQQLWIIDIEFFKKITMISLHSTNQSYKNKIICDYFDYLLFHLLLSTISCPYDQQKNLFLKFIQLYNLALIVKHYQLVYLLYCYFNHHIIQQLLMKFQFDEKQMLLLNNLLTLNEYKQLIEIDISTKEGAIPCLSQLQLYLFRFDNFSYQEEEINDNKWKNLGTLLFQVSHLQILIKQLKGSYKKYKNILICNYLKQVIRNELDIYFKCNKQEMEILMFKIYNSQK